MELGSVLVEAHHLELELRAIADGARPAHGLRVLIVGFEDEHTLAVGHRSPELKLGFLAGAGGALTERHHGDDGHAGDRECTVLDCHRSLNKWI